MSMTEPPPTPPAAQPLYPHTIAAPAPPPQTLADPPQKPSVNVDALCDLFDRSMSAVMYLDRQLNDADKQAVFDGHQLVVEYDTVRGVDSVRHARPDELP